MRSLIMRVAAAAILVSPASAFAAEGAKQPATSCDKATMEANKRLITDMFKQDRGGDGIKKFYDMMDPGYVQHNPEFKRFGEMNNLKGREEFMALLPFITSAEGAFAPPPPDAPKGNPLYMVMADCDMVVVLQQRYLADPQNKGKYYEAFWFDAWRVKNGKLTEHWDAAEIPKKLPSYLQKPLSQLPKPPAPPAGK